MRSATSVSVLIAVMFTASAARAGTIEVMPGESIQAAIDVAVNGDDVWVHAGTYVEVLDLLGKEITVRGVGGTVVIDGDGTDTVVRCVSGETVSTSLIDLTIRNGLGASIGGGMLVGSSSPTIRRCVFEDNHAPLAGGGIIVAGGAAKIIDCTFLRNSAEGGGGVLLFASPGAELVDCTFVANVADFGGAVFADEADITIIDCAFLNNFAAEEGGGLYAYEGPRVEGCTFQGNTAGIDGGAVWHAWSFYNESSLVLDTCVFDGNAAGARGGAVHLVEDQYKPDGGPVIVDQPVLVGCAFRFNTAPLGGAIHNDSGDPSITSCDFRFNGAPGGFGGAIASRIGDLQLSSSTFVANIGDEGGGAISIVRGDSTIDACTFTLNQTNEGGGAIRVEDTTTTVINSVFEANTASERGGAIYGLGSSPKAVNCTFVANTAGMTGGAVYGVVQTIAVRNSILWGNAPTQASGSVIVRYSAVEFGFSGTGNIELDPEFVDAAAGDFRLRAGSPAIDAADNVVVPAGIAADLDDHPRFRDDPGVANTGNPDGVNPPVDMGAYEFQGSSTLPCRQDLTGDGVVGFEELLAVIVAWGACGGCPEDLDGNGVVDFADVLAVITAWGPCPSCVPDCSS